MLQLLNALVSVVAATTVLTGSSLHRRIALVLALAGSTIANFCCWLAAPPTWAAPMTPWVCSAVGTVAAIAIWSAIRAYDSIFDPETRR